MNLANLIIAGVTKAGTTSLFTYLAAHSDICGASQKETCYFLPIRFGKDIPPIREYAKFFNKCHEQPYFLEASPGYFLGGKALALKIKELLPEVRIIIILRNPVERCISFFKFHKNMLHLPQNMAIKDYLLACGSFQEEDFKVGKNYIYYGLLSGVYLQFMGYWLNVFGDNIRVYFFEELKKAPEHLLFKICDWLDIDRDLYKRYNFIVENKTRNYNFRFLHNCALQFNKTFEKKLRSYIFIKRILRNIYFAINGCDVNEEIDRDSLEYLANYYYSSNQKLRDLLVSHGYKEFPSWLEQFE